MAKFNKEILADSEEVREKAAMECGMYLQCCLTKKELDALKRDWNEAGGHDTIPWWQFAFENITVSYSGMERKEIIEETNNNENEELEM